MTRRYDDLQIRCFRKNYAGHARSKVVLGLASCNKLKPMFPLTAYVFKNFTFYTASAVRLPKWWPHLRGLSLANPNPASKEPIHLLIGADLYESLLLGDLRQDPLGTPTAQKTELGWIISGPIDIGPRTVFKAHVSHPCIPKCNTDSLLWKSWADENISAETQKPTAHYVHCASNWRLSHRYSNWPRLVTRTAYARTFIENSKRKKNVQLGKELSIPKASSLRTLNPMLGEDSFTPSWQAVTKCRILRYQVSSPFRRGRYVKDFYMPCLCFGMFLTQTNIYRI